MADNLIDPTTANEAAELVTRMQREGWTRELKFTGRLFYTDEDGQLTNVDVDTQWYEFMSEGEQLFVRYDDDKFHCLGIAEFGPTDVEDEANHVHADDCDCPVCAPKKMYVACRQCGEVFDDLAIAHPHQGTCGSDQGWDVVTEDEAF